MEKKRQIDCFLPYGTASMVDSLIAQLSKERVEGHICVGGRGYVGRYIAPTNTAFAGR